MNPFRYEHSDPWSDDFVDVESINAHVSDGVLDAVAHARSSTLDADRPRSTLFLVRGPAGSGKTHLFARLRRRCGQRATFVLIRPEIGVEPNLRLLLAKVVEALGRWAFGSQERQVDVVVGATLGVLRGQRTFPMATLEELRRGDPERLEEALEDVLEDVEQTHCDVSLNYLEQLLRVPFAKSAGRRAAMTWLAGNEPTEAQLRRLGLRAALADAELLPALRTLALVSALRGPLVLVFDQLENLYDSEERSGRINAYGNLVAELFDSVAGLVMVQMAVDSEWTRRIRPQLSLPQRSRLESRQFMLELPTAEQREQLVRAWTAQLPEPDRSPFPFSRAHLAAWRAQPGLTPRMLLIACRRVLEGDEDAVLPVEDPASSPFPGRATVLEPAAPGEQELAERIASLWQQTIDEVRSDVRRIQSDELGLAPERLVGALFCVGRLLRARVSLRSVPVNPTVVLTSGDRVLEIGVLQTRNAGAMGRALERACARAAQAPVLIVRELALSIPSTWRTVDRRRRDLVDAQHGTWLDLSDDEICRLLALHDFESKARSGDLAASDGATIPEANALAWIESRLAWRDWVMTRAIVGCLGGEHAPAIDGVSAPSAAKQPVEVAAPMPTLPPTGPGTPVLDVLRRLHLASLDRLVREVRQRNASVSRRQVLQQLREAGAEVAWIGQSLVCTREVAK